MAVTTAAVASLIILIAIKGGEVLASTALSLAILAFILQIVVFIAQSLTTSQQSFNSEVLNSETRTLLSQVRANTSETQRMMTGQFDRVLEHVLQSLPETIKESAKASGGDLETDGNIDMRDLRRRLSEQVEELTDSGGTPSWGGSSSKSVRSNSFHVVGR